MNDYEIQKIRDTAFCSGYNTAVSKYENKIAELEKENAELRKDKKELCHSISEGGKACVYLNEQLTKAKELLKKWVELYKPKLEGYPITPIQEQTEQFLNEVEK